MRIIQSRINNAQGCLAGQLAGDALGSLVEFQSPAKIRRVYPDGVRVMQDGGTWDTIAGQPTDDSELALLLARSLVEEKTYSPEKVLERYQYWLHSEPFDCGMTIASGLNGNLNHESQANGALMRISPLGIFGSNYSLEQVAEWARLDAALTHPHSVCQQANALFCMAIAYAINNSITPHELYQQIVSWSDDLNVDASLREVIQFAEKAPPSEYVHQQGWLMIAFPNALWQLLHAPNLEEGVVDTIMCGGDTDTNAAICGALLGAIRGIDELPEQWSTCLKKCRPEAGNRRVKHARPRCFWPIDVLELAAELVTGLEQTT